MSEKPKPKRGEKITVLPVFEVMDRHHANKIDTQMANKKYEYLLICSPTNILLIAPHPSSVAMVRFLVRWKIRRSGSNIDSSSSRRRQNAGSCTTY